MDWLATLPALDAAAAVVLVLACARGLVTGAVREAFSLAAIALACIAVRVGTAPAAAWLGANAPFPPDSWVASILAGSAIAVGTLVAVGLAGRGVRGSLRAAGLGFWDRLAGGAFGAVEGALLVAVGVAIANAALGPDHPALRDTTTLAAYDAALEWGTGDRLEDVAAPPLDLRR